VERNHKLKKAKISKERPHSSVNPEEQIQ